MAATTHDQAGRRVVIAPAERLDGSAMQQAGAAVRDLKLIYPETGFDAMTLCLGVVEIDPRTSFAAAPPPLRGGLLRGAQHGRTGIGRRALDVNKFMTLAEAMAALEKGLRE